MPATDAYGNPGAVAAGELIESAWGNAAATRVVRAGPTAARPATPHPGAKWYSTDDKKEYTYHTTNGWVRSDWNQAWGFQSLTQLPTDLGNGSAAGPIAILVSSAVPNFVTGRRHRVSMLWTYKANTPGDAFFLLLFAGSGTAGGVLAASGLQIPSGSANLQTPGYLTGVDSSGTVSQWTFGINRTSGGVGNMTIVGTSTVYNALIVEDVGPVTRI